ncbi:MAG: hypothetical protein AAF352_07620 [Pseudomonadota bacterium]
MQGIDAIDYVNKILAGMAAPADAVQYARILADLSIKRQLIASSDDMNNRAYFPNSMDDDGTRQIEEAEQALFRLGDKGSDARKIVSLEDAGLAAIEAAGKAYISVKSGQKCPQPFNPVYTGPRVQQHPRRHTDRATGKPAPLLIDERGQHTGGTPCAQTNSPAGPSPRPCHPHLTLAAKTFSKSESSNASIRLTTYATPKFSWAWVAYS